MNANHERPARSPFTVGMRGKRILSTGAWSLTAKVTAAANLFLTVPFVLQALGTAQFGIWATLVSLVAFAGFLDFGIGNGAMNMIAAAHGRGDQNMVHVVMQEARRTMLAISFTLVIIGGLVLPWIPWQRLLGAPDLHSSSVRASVTIVLLTTAVAVPLNLANRVQLAVGRGDIAFRWQAIGQGIAACAVILLARSGAGLEALVAGAVSAPLLTAAANNLQLWRSLPNTSHGGARKRAPTIAARIRKEGTLFFCLQLSAAIAYSADLPLISAFTNAEEAGAYSIVQRLFSVIPICLGLIWAPLWPTYRQALAVGDFDWARRTLRSSIFGAVGLAVLGVVTLGIGFEHISKMWLTHPIEVSSWLIAGFALWCVIDAAGTSIATFLNAASVMRYQVIVGGIFALSCLGGKVWAINHLGVWALPWVTAITFLLANMLPTILLWPRLMATINSKTY